MSLLPARTYIVPGTPIPLQRPRSRVNGRPWDPQKTEKLICMNTLEDQHGSMPMYSGYLRADFTFYFRIPQTHYRFRDDMLLTHHNHRPDLSNLVKFYEDCAQGILYRDDCIIAMSLSMKLYDDEPRTEIYIVPLDEHMRVFQHFPIESPDLPELRQRLLER